MPVSLIEIGVLMARRRRLKRLKETKNAKSRKLSDPKDKDDPRWVKRRLDRLDQAIAKKEKSAEHKREQRKVGRNRRAKRASDS